MNTRPVAWFHAQFEVPAEWETVRHSANRLAGRLEFATRAGFQALFSWQACRREPDAHRMMLEFLRREIAKTDPERARNLRDLRAGRVGAFETGHAGEGLPCLAARYLPAAGQYVQWIFPRFDAARFAREWSPLLLGTRPNDGPRRRWCLFGLDLRLPDELDLEHAEVFPADVTLLFESRRKLAVHAHRWGLPEELLRGTTLADFYHRVLLRRHSVVRRVYETALGGRRAVGIDFDRRGEFQLDTLAGRRWKGRGTAWHDAAEQRIYAVEVAGRGRVPDLAPGEMFSHVAA